MKLISKQLAHIVIHEKIEQVHHLLETGLLTPTQAQEMQHHYGEDLQHADERHALNIDDDIFDLVTKQEDTKKKVEDVKKHVQKNKAHVRRASLTLANQKASPTAKAKAKITLDTATMELEKVKDSLAKEAKAAEEEANSDAVSRVGTGKTKTKSQQVAPLSLQPASRPDEVTFGGGETGDVKIEISETKEDADAGLSLEGHNPNVITRMQANRRGKQARKVHQDAHGKPGTMTSTGDVHV